MGRGHDAPNLGCALPKIKVAARVRMRRLAKSWRSLRSSCYVDVRKTHPWPLPRGNPDDRTVARGPSAQDA